MPVTQHHDRVSFCTSLAQKDQNSQSEVQFGANVYMYHFGNVHNVKTPEVEPSLSQGQSAYIHYVLCNTILYILYNIMLYVTNSSVLLRMSQHKVCM